MTQKKLLLSWAMLPLILLTTNCTTFSAGPVGNKAVPQPAKGVSIARYLGLWYEIGRYEAGFQKDCEAVTAEYSLKKNGDIRVINSCRKGSIDGKISTAEGKAKVVSGSDGAKLRVSFFGPFYGDYWVLDRDDNYRWAIVGEPSGRYLWLLSREARPSEDTKKLMLTRVSAMGYNLKQLRFTKQP